MDMMFGEAINESQTSRDWRGKSRERGKDEEVSGEEKREEKRKEARRQKRWRRLHEASMQPPHQRRL